MRCVKILKRIYCLKGQKKNKAVYRVIKYGTINRDIDMDLHGQESSCIIERDKIDRLDLPKERD